MAEAVLSIPVTVTISIDGEYLTAKVQESTVTVRIGGRPAQASERLKLERGQTLFDVVLDAAKTMVRDHGAEEFTAADLYHAALDKYPDLKLRRSSFSSHVVSSAPNHSSYGHYTAKRRYFRYLGDGKYSLDPSIDLQAPPLRIASAKTRLPREA
ncbi:hypothetical protein ACFLX9_04250 [Chloroflexota bacterium]